MANVLFAPKKLSLAVVAALSLSVVGCNSAGSSNPSTDTDSKPSADIAAKPVPTPPPTSPNLPKSTSATRIQTAIKTGNSHVLLDKDHAVLVKDIQTSVNAIRDKQKGILMQILTDANGKPLNQTLKLTNQTVPFYLTNPTVAMPLMQGSNGFNLAVLSTAYKGRGLSYATDIISKVNKGQHSEHHRILANAMRWLVSGHVNNKRPIKVKIASVNYNVSELQKYLNRLDNVTATVVRCRTATQSCLSQADLVAFGHGKDSIHQGEVLSQSLMKQGKAVLYLGNNWNQGESAIALGKTLGYDSNGYMGNYYQSSAALSSTQTNLDNFLKKADVLKGISQAIDIAEGTDNSMIDANHPAITALNHHNRITTLNKKGQSLFANTGDSNDTDNLWKKLILLADNYRKNASYQGQKPSNSSDFMQTYLADTWIDYLKDHQVAAINGAGEYMPATAKNIAVSQDWESIDITLPQSSGHTLIGRASIMGKPVQIEVVNNDNSKTTLAIQTSFIRANGSPFGKDGYIRPLKPNSPSIPIKNGMRFTSPYGGPLVLKYDNAKANQTITLRVKGVAKYAHYDHTQPMTQTQIDQANQALADGRFGWSTVKLNGGEIQQTINYAQKAIGNQSIVNYANQLQNYLFTSNQLALGYNNQPLSKISQQRCQQLGWNCTGEAHNPKDVQHIVGYVAKCGFLCSGHPIDGRAGIGIGWGYAHELGHNTVQRTMTVAFKSSETGKPIGCLVECDNNHLAGLSALRQYEGLGTENPSKVDNFAHWQIYQQIRDARQTGLTAEALRKKVEKNIWDGNGYQNNNGKRAFLMQQAFLFSKLIDKKAQPDSDGVFSYFALLSIGDRLVKKMDLSKASQQNKNAFGLGAYNKNNFSNPELDYMLSSVILGHDLKELYTLYGIPLSDKAKSSVSMLNLPAVPLKFYALPKNKANHLNLGQWIDLPAQGNMPTYPYPVS